ncbi:hypothetical protein [Magnetospirillum sp. SS-4]|uniref:hypothetical protein n=1 Tax=Magnetospirillum sp. SS-4 TaxID=2681465 RepID=UPI001381A805|nr:hypothetical protein [Magnetospirillum sp. SS-4]CAA7620977.1 membrane hypothetical protein [Magnetospirillum sp. SS-4]
MIPLRGRALVAAAALAVAAALLLLLVRAESAISFARPLLVVTSGAEEEGVLGILRAMDGAAYTDPSRIPFAASYYNWLFFGLFATAIGAVKGALGLDVAWVPTIGRFVGLAGALLCGWIAWACLRRAAPSGNALVNAHNRLLAVWLAIGPLVGWWALSLNPELWATALSEAAILAVLTGYERRRLASVALAAALAAAAWGFKQSYLFVPLGLGLFLLLRLEIRAIMVLAAVFAAGVAAPVLLGGPEYRGMLLAFQGSDFAWWQLERNLLNTAPKIVPVVLGALLVLPLLRRWRAVQDDTPLLLGLCCVLACLPVLPASAKVGAAENYYFPLVFFLALLAGRGVAGLEQRGWPRLPTIALTAAWLLELAACALVVAGIGGVRSVRDMDARYRVLRDCVAALPAPMYSHDPYLQLPWMREDGPRFVLAYQYDMERAKGRVFEGGGVGGLIRDGWFASLALPGGRAVIDGATLERYRRLPETCNGLDLYLRR